MDLQSIVLEITELRRKILCDLEDGLDPIAEQLTLIALASLSQAEGQMEMARIFQVRAIANRGR